MVLLFCNWPYETLRPVLFCFALTTFIILLCFLFNATFLSHSAWNIVDESGFRFGKGGCEMKRENDFLVQRANSVSNFTFAFSGLVMFACAYKDYKNGKSKLGASVLSQTSNLATFPNYIVAFPELSVKLGCACLLMAATSFIWHASMSTVGADLDFGSMCKSRRRGERTVASTNCVGAKELRLQPFFLFLSGLPSPTPTKASLGSPCPPSPSPAHP